MAATAFGTLAQLLVPWLFIECSDSSCFAWPATYFSLLADHRPVQRKVSKRKHTPRFGPPLRSG